MFTKKYTFLIGLGIFLDQISKGLATAHLDFYKPLMLLPNILHLQLVHNYGAAFGIFQHFRWSLILVSFFVILMVMVFYRHLALSIYSKTAMLFLMMGAFGNLIDRIRLGYVVDFIDIRIIPVFNFADIYINLCVLLFILEFFLVKPPNEV